MFTHLYRYGYYPRYMPQYAIVYPVLIPMFGDCQQHSNKRFTSMPYRVFPPANPKVFTTSVVAFQALMSDGSRILERIANSKKFASQLMNAAQKSDDDTVNQLIQTIGVESHVDTLFTPDSIRFELSSEVEDIECCKLTMALRW